MKETAARLRHTLNHNKLILSEYVNNLEEVKQTALEMIENAEQKIKNVKYLIAEQEKELIALEGGRSDEKGTFSRGIECTSSISSRVHEKMASTAGEQGEGKTV